jgi:SNF2 family DNA or RNA helicase
MFRSRLIAPYQHAGVNWIVARETSADRPGGILCDEMGLGKTVQMLAAMTLNVRAKTLIIVPKSIVSQWRSEVHRFVPRFRVHTFDGQKRTVPVFDNEPTVVIAPYSVIGTRKGSPACPLLDIAWDRVILDEAHEIRNPKSAMHVTCMQVKAPIRWVMTGTPVFNSLRDFVSLGAFIGLDRQTIQNYTEDVRARYVIRRTKVDLCKFNIRLELPPLDFENVELEMYPEERDIYEQAFEQGRQVVSSVVVNNFTHIQELLEAFLRVRQVMAWPQMYLDGIARKQGEEPEAWTGRSKKLETLMELIASHPKEKSLIFCQFIGEMDRIQELLVTAGVQTFRIDGSVDHEQRAERIQGFKTASTGVFLIQIKSGGVGLNLQEATRVYITCPAWNPATELQAIARSHRTGQTQKVTVRRLIYTGEEALPSVEQSILALQETKTKVCAEVLNDERIMAQIPLTKSKVSVRDLKKIFRV